MNGSALGKWVIVFGLGVIVIGLLIWVASKIGIPFGKLPGDIKIENEKVKFYFPIVTSIIISIILTILINLIFFMRK